MSSAQVLLLIVATALISSVVTLALGWLAFQHGIRPRLEARLTALAEQLEVRVKAGAGAAGQDLLEPLRAQVRGGVEGAATELLPKIRAEMTAGFHDAAAESLPAFREEVRNGFADAIASLATTEILGRTAGKVVRTGSSLVETGLSLLRSARSNERDD